MLLASCNMKTLYLRNVPDDLAQSLEELARRDSMSLNAVALRELRQAVAFRRNADLLWAQPTTDVTVADIVAAVRTGRDR